MTLLEPETRDLSTVVALSSGSTIQHQTGPNGNVSEIKILGGDEKLEPLSQSLKTAKFDVTLPDDGPERFVRQGFLSCAAYDPNCMSHDSPG
jgi:hypothetical protein